MSLTSQEERSAISTAFSTHGGGWHVIAEKFNHNAAMHEVKKFKLQTNQTNRA